MTSDPTWQPLHEELLRWERAGRTADFWLRDDDAVEATVALDRLLGLTGEFAVPVTLAVIPAFTGKALARRLEAAPHAAVAVHGWSHKNHSPEGQKKQEFGAHRPRDVMLEELARGLSHVSCLHGERALPMLVPPWNRIDAGLISDLGAVGFEALSVYGPPSPAPISVLNSNVDLMDWHGTRGCRDHSLLVRDIVAGLGRAFKSGGDPVGLLTHHLVHDEMAWSFLARLFEMTSRHEGSWRSAGTMLGQAGAIDRSLERRPIR